MLDTLKLLIVEDDHEFNSQLGGLLSSYCHEVESAYDGVEGLDKYKEYKPDIVISDIRMPRMNGLEMSKKIKELNSSQQIIILSAYDVNEYFLDSIDIGVSGYVLKPIDLRKVLVQLQKCAQYIYLERERDQLQKELTFNENYLKTVFNTSKDIIVTSDGNEIEKANNAMLQFTGFENLEDFRKKYDCVCDMFLEKEGYIFGKKIEGKTWTEYILGKPDIYHKAIIKTDDEEHVFGVHVEILEVYDYKRYLIILTDITMLLKQQAKLQEKDELIKIQSKQAAVGELIGIIAHQFKQPLSVISLIATSQITDIKLGDEIGSKSIEEDALTVLDQIEYLASTIDDFRNFLKPDREKETKEIKEVSDLVVKILGKALKVNDITLSNELNEEMEITTFFNDIVQVLINILNNSKDAFNQNNIENREIKLRNNVQEGMIEFIIEDNAGGVTKKILDRLYEPYFTTKSDDKGTGIGLYMAKGIIEDHLNGTIISFNNDNNGLTTVITIPLS